MEETSSTIPKSDGCNDPGKMFIGGLNWQTSAEGMRQYFTKYGELKECFIMKDPVSKRSRGFGFITFVEPNSVEMVLDSCPHELDGKKIDPKVAVPKRAPVKMVTATKKIFVGGLSTNTSEEDMKTHFSIFGKITEVMLMIDKATERHRGFGFVTFETEKSADDACKNQFHSINNKKVEVKKAQPKDVMFSLQGGRGRSRGGLFGRGIFYPLPGFGRAPAFPTMGLGANLFQGYNAYHAAYAAFQAQGRGGGRGRGRGNMVPGYPAIGHQSYPYAFMSPGDQRRAPGGQYYADYATIGNTGGRGTSRQEVQQHNTIQDFSQHDYGGGMQTLNGYHHQGQHGYGPPPTSPVSRGFSSAASPGPVPGVGQDLSYMSGAAGGSGANELGFSATSPQPNAFNPQLQF